MSVAGGAWMNENPGLNKETGWCSAPHMAKSAKDGAQVFVFFEAGDLNKPVYFAAAQSGPGWFAEHSNQHVFQSDNIRVRIDEDPAHPASTCKFDTYNDRNNVFSIEDGTKTARQTRLDIEVLAKDINAVNIQIHGDVNMKVLGDWYVHHEGDKHETHIGNHYVYHEGETIIEHVGETIENHTGDVSRIIDGAYNDTITKTYMLRVFEDTDIDIFGNTNVNIGSNFNKIVGGDSLYTIIGNESHKITGSETFIIGTDYSLQIAGKCDINAGGTYMLQTYDNISLNTRTGNIDLKTNGEFEIADIKGNITSTGYKNLGTRGNIRLESTFGNIGLITKEDKKLVDLEEEYVCIAWNPSYLNQMGIISKFVPGFDISMISAPIASPPTTLLDALIFLKTAPMFDGFPTFLPCKMIMQNPNIAAPSGNFLSEFRSIDDDWQNITNTKYWKLISKVVGNIDLISWAGDINIKTQGALGNGGNINLVAQNKHGALPGYEVGNVKIVADTPFRIFTDPRDLFLDTHLLGKLTGQFSWFSSVGGISKVPPAITVKPLNPVQMILSLLGIPFQFGFANADSGGGGCMQCITDVITQTAVDLQLFSILPWAINEQLFLAPPEHHKFNAAYGSLVHKDITQGSVSLLKQTSNGYGHAVDTYGLDEIYGGTNYSFGNILLNGVGSYECNVGKNANITAKTGNWNFGVKTTVETDWIKPSKGLNPIDAIIGESPLAFPGIVCSPIIKTIETKYLNEYDGRKFGNYISKFSGVTDTGAYMIPMLPIGCFGYTENDFSVDVPGFTSNLHDIQLKISSAYTVENNPYVIDIDSLNLHLNKLYTFNDLIVENTYLNDETYGVSNEKQPNKKPANTNDKNDTKKKDQYINKFDFQLKFGGWSWVTSGKVEMEPLDKQLPNTAAAISLAVPVVQTLAKFIPGIGDLVVQGAKMLPKMTMNKENDFYTHMDYVYDFYTKTTQKAWMLQSELVSGGLICVPSSKPIVYGMEKVALPDLAGLADGMLSVGSLFDPIGTITKLFMEELPKALGTTEANVNLGVGLPKFIADPLGAEDLICGKAGLFPGCKFQTTVNLLDSEFDRKAAFVNFDANIPLPPTFKTSVNANVYAVTNGIDASVNFPIIQGKCKVSLIKDTLALDVQGPLPPGAKLIIGGKEIINIPGGGAGLLGGGLIKAILNVFF